MMRNTPKRTIIVRHTMIERARRASARATSERSLSLFLSLSFARAISCSLTLGGTHIIVFDVRRRTRRRRSRVPVMIQFDKENEWCTTSRAPGTRHSCTIPRTHFVWRSIQKGQILVTDDKTHTMMMMVVILRRAN